MCHCAVFKGITINIRSRLLAAKQAVESFLDVVAVDFEGINGLSAAEAHGSKLLNRLDVIVAGRCARSANPFLRRGQMLSRSGWQGLRVFLFPAEGQTKLEESEGLEKKISDQVIIAYTQFGVACGGLLCFFDLLM